MKPLESLMESLLLLLLLLQMRNRMRRTLTEGRRHSVLVVVPIVCLANIDHEVVLPWSNLGTGRHGCPGQW
jgi:hypothetical protein